MLSNDVPPAMIYEIPAAQESVIKMAEQKQREPISVMAFGQAPDYGVREPNTVIYFYDKVTRTMNAKIIDSRNAGINGSSWAFYRGGSVTVEFNLGPRDVQEGLGLYFIHLSSDLHRGTYDSAIRILVNGQVFVDKYVPKSHDWIFDDHFDLSPLVSNKVLHAGNNTITVELHDDARSAYWLHKMMVK